MIASKLLPQFRLFLLPNIQYHEEWRMLEMTPLILDARWPRHRYILATFLKNDLSQYVGMHKGLPFPIDEPPECSPSYSHAQRVKAS
jgi:hypothetical protein